MKQLLFILTVFFWFRCNVMAQTKDSTFKNSQPALVFDSLWRVYNKLYDHGDSLLKIADSYFNRCNKDSAELYYIKAFDAFKVISPEKQKYIETKREELRIPEYCMNTPAKEYQKLLAMGDRAFDAKDYTKAKKYYQDALNIRPGEKEAIERIKECEKIIEQK